MGRVAVVIWTILRVVAAVLILGWAALHLRPLDRVIGVGFPEWLKPAGMVLHVVGGIVVPLCGGMLSTPGNPNQVRRSWSLPLCAKPDVSGA
jgi:hypothetical protein